MDCDKAIKLDQEFAGAYNNRGLARHKLEKYEEAIADFNKAIELDPKLAGAYNNRGIVKEDKKDYTGAIADYNRAIELGFKVAGVYCNRGNCKAELKDFKGAIADHDEAIKIKLAEKLLAKNEKSKIAGYEKATEIDPEFASIYFNRGFVKEESKDYRGGVADYDEAIRLDTSNEIYKEARQRVQRKLDDSQSGT